MGGSRSHSEKNNRKIVPKLSYSSTDILGVVYHMYSVCIYCTLLKVVSHYDLSVLFMSVMGFKKHLHRWCVGGVRSIQVFF